LITVYVYQKFSLGNTRLFCRISGFCHLFGMKDKIMNVPIKIYENVLHSPIIIIIIIIITTIILCFLRLFFNTPYSLSSMQCQY